MSDIINRVPRELLERIDRQMIAEGMAPDDQLRALLSEQSQAAPDEAVGYIEVWNEGTAAEYVEAVLTGAPLPHGTKLYTHPAPSQPSGRVTDVRTLITEAIGFEWQWNETQTVNGSDLLRIASLLLATPHPEQPQASAAQSAALVKMPDVDDLANFIRFTDGNHKMGAGALAERIVDWLSAPSAAQSAPAGEQPAPYGWVAAGQFFAAREDAADAAEKTPCVEVYSRPQVLAILSRSAERQALAEELARLLKQSGDEFRALKSAPAGEREAVSYEHWKVDMEPYGFSGLDAFQAGASWQRTHSAGVPEGWREFIEDCANTAGGMVNGNRLSIRAQELLAAAAAQPAAQGSVRTVEVEIEGLGCCQLQTSGDKVFMPAVTVRDILRMAAAQDQGEVQRLREALGDAAQSLETISNGAGLDEFMKDASDVRCYARSRAGVARAALAASTGQEVKP